MVIDVFFATLRGTIRRVELFDFCAARVDVQTYLHDLFEPKILNLVNYCVREVQ